MPREPLPQSASDTTSAAAQQEAADTTLRLVPDEQPTPDQRAGSDQRTGSDQRAGSDHRTGPDQHLRPDQDDAPMTVNLTIVRADPQDDPSDLPSDDSPDGESPDGERPNGERLDRERLDADPPKDLPGVIAHHLDALRSRDADGEVLDLVTTELRRITGVRNVRALRGRHSA